MNEPKPKAEFKPVNISKPDWEEYNQTALLLSAERGERISIPALLKEAFHIYTQSL